MNRLNDVDKAEREIFNFYNSLLELRNNIILLEKYLKIFKEVLIFIILNIFVKLFFLSS